MNRRALLTGAALCLAGCNTPSGNDDGDTREPNSRTDEPTDDAGETTTDPPVTANPDDPMLIRVNNGPDRDRTITLTLTRGNETLLTETVTLDPDGQATVDPDITERGDYELRAETADGQTARMPFDVGDYELRMGSDLIVAFRGDELMILIEE